MKKIRIGQIGIGHNHGEAKMLSVRKFPELFEVTGYAEENERWVKERGGYRGYAGLARLRVDEVIRHSDAILVETDVPHLTETAQRCIDAGKHIHMDKPASGPLASYRRLLDTARERRLVVQLGYMYRYNPAVMACLDRIRAGDLGEIFSINAEMSTCHPVGYKEWLSHFPGGIMYILGSHLVDLVVTILGEPEKVTSFLKHTGQDGVDFADNTLSVLAYEKALARIFVSSVEVNGWGRRQLVVSGSRGTISILPLENECHMTYADRALATMPYEDRKQTIAVRDIPKDCRYDDMMRDFYAYIQGEKENPYSYDHEYLVQKVLYEIIGKNN